MKKNNFKINDTVIVISGNFFGETGKVVKINREKKVAYLENIYREKFVKRNKDKAVENQNDSDNVSEKKRILIPINVSNLKKFNVIEGESVV